MLTQPGRMDLGQTSNAAGWRCTGIFSLLYAVGYLDRQILTLLVDPIRKDIGATDFQISLLQGAAFVICFAVCGLPIGWAVDRYPRRWIVWAGMTFASAATICAGFSRTYFQLLLSRCGVGAGEASLSPAAYSMLSDYFPRERLGTAMAVYSMGAIIGSALSLVLGGLAVQSTASGHTIGIALYDHAASWQRVFLLTGPPGVLITLLVFLVREPTRKRRMPAPATDRPRQATTIGTMLKTNVGFYTAHFVGFSLFNVMATAFTSWSPTYLMRKFDWSPGRVGTTLGAQNLVFEVAGMLVSGYVVDRLMRRGVTDAHLRYYVWMVGLTGIAAMTSMLANDIVVVLVAMSFVKFVIPFIAVAAAALQITTPAEYRGRVSAIFLFIYNIVGFGLGPSVTAAISDFMIPGSGNIGVAVAITVGIVAPLAMICFALGLRPMRRAVAAQAHNDS